MGIPNKLYHVILYSNSIHQASSLNVVPNLPLYVCVLARLVLDRCVDYLNVLASIETPSMAANPPKTVMQLVLEVPIDRQVDSTSW